MVNNINGLTPTTTNSTGKKTAAVGSTGAENKNSASPAQETATDSFELSSQAQLLSQLEAQISELPEVDQARVDALRESIKQGQFTVDSFHLAQDIINFELK